MDYANNPQWNDAMRRAAEAAPADMHSRQSKNADPNFELVSCQAPNNDPEVCWLLDVRKYGIEAANNLHPEE